jgi:hypothetical protein
MGKRPSNRRNLAIAVYVLLRERHGRLLEEERAQMRARMTKLFGSFKDEIELTQEAEHLVPIYGAWKRTDKGQSEEVGKNDASGKYTVQFELFNGLDRPLSDLTVWLQLTGDWVLADYESRPYPPGVRLCEHLIVPPGQWFRFQMNDGEFYELPVERVDAGGHLSAMWKVGTYEYNWDRYGEAKTYRSVRTPSDKKPADHDKQALTGKAAS